MLLLRPSASKSPTQTETTSNAQRSSCTQTPTQTATHAGFDYQITIKYASLRVVN
jgi:hypothetical protein